MSDTSMGNHLKPTLLLVAILTVIAVGVDSVSTTHERLAQMAAGGVLAQASTPEAPTLEKTEMEKLCDAKKKEGAASSEAQSWFYTIPFEQKDITEVDKCVGAVFDPTSAAAKSAPAGTDPTKNPETYKCVGKSARVTITAGGTGTLFSTPSPSFPAGQCMTIYCSADYPPICSAAKQFSGTQSVRSMASDSTIASGLSADQRAGILALGPMDPAQQAALDNAFAANPPRTVQPLTSSPATSAAVPAPLPIPPIPPASQGPIQNSANFDLPSDSVATLDPATNPNPATSNSTAFPQPTVFDPSGNYPQSTFVPSSGFDAISGTTDPGSVAAIPASESAIQTGYTPSSVSALHEQLAIYARTSPVEHAVVATVSERGSIGSLSFNSGEANSVGYDPLAFAEALNESEDQVRLIHTHPLISIYEGKPAELAAVQNGEQPYPTSPPSITDVQNTVGRSLSSNGPNVISDVVDPSGVWSFSVDRSSPEGQKYLADFNSAVIQPTEGLSGTEYTSARRAGLASLAQQYPILNSIDQSGVQADANPYLYNDPAKRAELIAQYQTIGIRLTYTPFPTGSTPQPPIVPR